MNVYENKKSKIQMEDFIYNRKIKIIKLTQSLTNCDHSYNKLINIRMINTI